MSSQVAAASEAMTVLARDAMSVFEAAVAATGRAAARAGAGPEQAPTGTEWADVTVQDAGEEPESPGPPEGPPSEPDDRG
jgi:hypothetical protein